MASLSDMAQPSPSKRKFYLMMAVLVLLLSTVVLWSIQAFRYSKASISELGLQGIILLLVLLFMIPILKNAWSNARLGLPMHDERSKKITTLAGYHAFQVSIYLWLGIMVFEEYLTVHSAGALAIVVASVTFGIVYVILSRRSKLG